MDDKEKQIEEMTEIIKADYKEWLDITGCLPEGTSYYYECLGGAEDCAKKLYDNGYRKVENITLNIDLGDCTPEQIKEITEQFNKAVATPFVPIPKSEEQIRKEVAIDILKKWWKNNIATVNEDSNDYVEEIVYEYGINYNDFRREVDE